MSTNPSKLNIIRQNIKSLEGEMISLNQQLDLKPEDMFPNDNLLPGINDIEIFNYQEEIETIKQDCDETLECLSSLYLNPDILEQKNIIKIIRDDAAALADLRFSLFCSKRALINLMKQLDMGINDPEMYQSVGVFQKEIRDSIKMLYDIQKKMKESYKEIKSELTEINTGGDDIKEIEHTNSDDETYHIVDFKKLNSDIDDYMKEKKN
jgi:hypothetical protein